MLQVFKRLLEPIYERFVLIISKAVINIVNDTGGLQFVQVDLGDGTLIDGVERIQNFGFSSYPEKGAQAIVLCIGGNREHPIVIVADDENYRPNLSKGESAVYNSKGMIIKLKDGLIEINDGSTLLAKDGVLTGNTINPVTGAPFATIPTDVSSKVRVKH